MPSFYTEDEAADVVRAALASGSLTHNDLVETLEAAGHGGAIEHLLTLVQAGVITASVKTFGIPGQPPVLRYSLPMEV